MAAQPIPPFVPCEVALWVADQRKARGLAGRAAVISRINRLVAPATATLWTRLNALAAKHRELNPRAVCMTAVTAPDDWRRVSRTPRADVVKDGTQLNDQILSFTRRFKAFKSALSHSQRSRLDTAAITFLAVARSDDATLPVYCDEIKETGLDRYLPTPERYLTALGELTKALALEQDALRPRKANDANADRTFLIRTMKHHFKSSIGRFPYELIADIVNAVLARTDTTADTVRKA